MGIATGSFLYYFSSGILYAVICLRNDKIYYHQIYGHMKKVSVSFILSMGILFFAVTANAGIKSPAINKFSPSLTLIDTVKFDTMWVTYDVKQEGKLGMIIHLKFSMNNMKGVECSAAIYFMNADEDDEPLLDINSQYASQAGEVAVFKDLKPGYDKTDYKDLQIFMPYEELDLEPGEYNLSMDADIIFRNGDLIRHLQMKDFTYTKPKKTTEVTTTAPAPPTTTSPATTSTTTPDARFDKLWVDYDVTENGKLGMRIHTKFGTMNMKDVSAYLALYFSKTDGTILKSTTSGFSSSTGQLAIYRSIKPQYVNADFDDIQLFMPYSEIMVPTGKHNLKIEANLIYEKGGIIKRFKEHYFDLTK